MTWETLENDDWGNSIDDLGSEYWEDFLEPADLQDRIQSYENQYRCEDSDDESEDTNEPQYGEWWKSENVTEQDKYGIDATSFFKWAKYDLESWSFVEDSECIHDKWGLGRVEQVVAQSNKPRFLKTHFLGPKKTLFLDIGSPDSSGLSHFILQNYLIRELKQISGESNPFQGLHTKFLEKGIKSLWYISHVKNVPSIIKRGILSHNQALMITPKPIDISMPDVQAKRTRLEPVFERSIHDYAILYIKPVNPMLYVRKEQQHELAILEIDIKVVDHNEFLFTDGNAASDKSKFYCGTKDLDRLPFEVLNSKYWTDFDDGRRKRCSEVMIYPTVLPEYIRCIHVCSEKSSAALQGLGKAIRMRKSLVYEDW